MIFFKTVFKLFYVCYVKLTILVYRVYDVYTNICVYFGKLNINLDGKFVFFFNSSENLVK